MAATQFVAKAIVLDDDGNFLLLTRSETHPALAGLYDLPGGMIEDNEEPGDGVRREITEETALTTTEIKVAYTTTMLVNETSYPTLLYRAKVQGASPAVELSWEHSAYEWAPIEKLDVVEPQLAPTYRQALDYLRTNDILNNL